MLQVYAKFGLTKKEHRSGKNDILTKLKKLVKIMTYDDVMKLDPTVPVWEIQTYLNIPIHTWASSLANKHLDVVDSGIIIRFISIEEEKEFSEIWAQVQRYALNERKKEAIKTVGSNYDC